MTNFRIETPAQFFEYIVTTDVAEFLDRQPNLRAAYHACISLLSYRDWVWKAHVGDIWFIQGAKQPALGTKGEFQKALIDFDGSFRVVREIANFSKHMTDSSNTIVHEIGPLNTAAFNELPFNGFERLITVTIGGTDHDVRLSVRNNLLAWQKLNIENAW
ncbi:MAG: hypothetical protein K2X57_31835 [Xanthobacteraceae bacterium]|nr:hypothetical protein [Xanthobacteraceae bacterium]